jgi:hypothetical protein
MSPVTRKSSLSSACINVAVPAAVLTGFRAGGRDGQPIAAVDDLTGISLVQLPQADVVDLQPCRLQRLEDGEYRSDARLLGRAAGHGDCPVDASGLSPRRSATARSTITQALAPSESWLGCAP